MAIDIKVDSNDLNKLVANNSTIEGLNKSLDDLISQKVELLKAQLEKELNDSSSLIRSLVDAICGMPTHYYWIGGLLALGAGCYFLKDQLILKIIYSMIMGNKKANQFSEELADTVDALSNNVDQLQNEISRLDSQQAIIEGLPLNQLKDPIIKEFLIKLLTDENLFTLLELCNLLLDMDGANFDKLEYLFNSMGVNLTSLESRGRRIIRRGNFASFDS